MRLSKLRIAWPVFSGLAAVLLIVFWVRSYWIYDYGYKGRGNGLHLTVGSNDGALFLINMKLPFNGPTSPSPSWMFRSQKASDSRAPFELTLTPGNTRVRVPYLSLVLPIAAIAMAPWLRFQFSLRTLLIATTLVALLLGAVIWAIR
jgi:hypothetical protein